MAIVAPLVLLVLSACGFLMVRTQRRRLQGQIASLPPDARRRMRIVFPAVMGLILVVFFVVNYMVRPHA